MIYAMEWVSIALIGERRRGGHLFSFYPSVAGFDAPDFDRSASADALSERLWYPVYLAYCLVVLYEGFVFVTLVSYFGFLRKFNVIPT